MAGPGGPARSLQHDEERAASPPPGLRARAPPSPGRRAARGARSPSSWLPSPRGPGPPPPPARRATSDAHELARHGRRARARGPPAALRRGAAAPRAASDQVDLERAVRAGATAVAARAALEADLVAAPVHDQAREVRPAGRGRPPPADGRRASTRVAAVRVAAHLDPHGAAVDAWRRRSRAGLPGRASRGAPPGRAGRAPAAARRARGRRRSRRPGCAAAATATSQRRSSAASARLGSAARRSRCRSRRRRTPGGAARGRRRAAWCVMPSTLYSATRAPHAARWPRRGRRRRRPASRCSGS